MENLQLIPCPQNRCTLKEYSNRNAISIVYALIFRQMITSEKVQLQWK